MRYTLDLDSKEWTFTLIVIDRTEVCPKKVPINLESRTVLDEEIGKRGTLDVRLLLVGLYSKKKKKKNVKARKRVR